jgi:hypothetical protein
MQTVFNCCHGMSNAGKWICSTQGSETGGLVDEEIIGDESPAYKPQLQGGEDIGQSKLSPGGSNTRAYQRNPQAPIGHGEEDEKESAKVRLQRLIRDFAHDAVGPGLEIEAQSAALQGAIGSPHGNLQALMRMDRRLSRLELWPPSTSEGVMQGTAATLSVPLQQVASIAKGTVADENQPIDNDRDSSTLTVVQRSGPDLRLIFLDSVSRDRAYTCLRIFQMSVDQSMESAREGDSELTAYDSTMSP